MYANLAIKRFRGLRDVSVGRLARVNLLIGNNGTGKTTVLEALWLHSNPSADLVGRVDAFRSYAWDVPLAGLSTTSAPWRSASITGSGPIIATIASQPSTSDAVRSSPKYSVGTLRIFSPASIFERRRSAGTSE